MTRKRTGAVPSEPTERHSSSRESLMERIYRAVAEGLSLHAAAVRERVTVETLKSWLAEDEASRARYEKARAIGRSLVLDDVLALADALPGTGRADIRLKLAARKWWAAEVWKTSKPETPAQAKARIEAEKLQRKEQERAAEMEAYWERIRAIDAGERRQQESEVGKKLRTGEITVYAPSSDPAPVSDAAPPTPELPPSPPRFVPKPRRQPEFVSWLYR